MDGMKLFAIYLVVMNVLGVRSCGRIRGAPDCTGWRIPEKVLFGVSLLGEAREPGQECICSATKTKHWYFVVGMPLILVCQAALAIYLVHLYVL